MELQKALKIILSTYGLEMLDNPRFLSLVSDYGGFEKPSYRNILKSFIDGKHGTVFQKMNNKPTESQQLELQKLVSKMENQYGYSQELVNEIVFSIAGAIGWKTKIPAPVAPQPQPSSQPIPLSQNSPKTPKKRLPRDYVPVQPNNLSQNNQGAGSQRRTPNPPSIKFNGTGCGVAIGVIIIAAFFFLKRSCRQTEKHGYHTQDRASKIESIYEEGAYNLNDTSPYTADSAYADTTDGTLQEEKDDIRNNQNGIEDDISEEEISECMKANNRTNTNVYYRKGYRDGYATGKEDALGKVEHNHYGKSIKIELYDNENRDIYEQGFKDGGSDAFIKWHPLLQDMGLLDKKNTATSPTHYQNNNNYNTKETGRYSNEDEEDYEDDFDDEDEDWDDEDEDY
jgi:hypothetical protein